MSKHTPGPWTIGARGEFGTNNANIIFSNGGESSVATVYGLPMHTKLEEVDPRYAEGMANARLIAVVPELLEALKHAVEIAENKRPGTWDDLLPYRVLIAKAEGACHE